MGYIDNNKKKKPPLGLTPKWIRDEQRIDEIFAAMERYSYENVSIPIEWIRELESLVHERFHNSVSTDILKDNNFLYEELKKINTPKVLTEVKVDE